jgi:hypothetical protein
MMKEKGKMRQRGIKYGEEEKERKDNLNSWRGRKGLGDNEQGKSPR